MPAPSDPPVPPRLRIYPDPVLRARAVPVARFDDGLREFVRRMFEVMYEHRGIGLAAPQVGVSERIFVVNLSGEADRPEEERVFVNPELRSPAGEATEEEGCLSLPEIRLDVARPERISVAAHDAAGDRFELEAEGLLARCIQHEFDHLDGILFIARVPVTRRLMVKRQLKELERRYREKAG
jgi:peptide deformylase